MPSDVPSCRYVRRAVDAYADGELSADSTTATEAHLAHCRACRTRARWQRAVHNSMRRAVHANGAVRPSFEHRIRRALAQELREETREHSPGAQSPGRPPRRLPWRLLALAPAVALALVAFFEQTQVRTDAGAAKGPSIASITGVNVDQIIDDMLRLHATSADAPTSAVPFTELEREVSLPVHAPPEFERHGAHWLGARSVAVGNQRIASLVYRVSRGHCTLFLYDAERFPLGRSHYLKARAVDRQAVFAGTRRGYAMAAVERRGLGYAIATDHDLGEAVELAAAIR